MPSTYDFSRGGSFRPRLLQFIRGIRGPRENEVTLKQIVAYFKGTPEAFVKEAVQGFLEEEIVAICRTALQRKANARYVYFLTEKGKEKFELYVRDRACHTG